LPPVAESEIANSCGRIYITETARSRVGDAKIMGRKLPGTATRYVFPVVLQ
jgi:hypothetical protein